MQGTVPVFNEMLLRGAGMDDAPALAELISQLGYATCPEEMQARLRPILEDPQYLTLVAECNGRILAMASACIGRCYEKNYER